MHGFQIAQDLTKGLSSFMERKGYASVDDFRGISLQHLVTDHLKMNTKNKVVAVVNDKKCTGCSICFVACKDGAANAIRMKDKVAVVNKNACIGCGLCCTACPVIGTISLKVASQ